MKFFSSLIVMAYIVMAQPIDAKELVFAGSTTVQKRILEPSANAIEAATGIRISVRGINTGNGFQELIEGKIKASIASSPLDLILKNAGILNDGTYREYILLKDVIVPIVHLNNPIQNLTWQNLADINSGRVTNWKEVGGEDRKIIVITSQPTAATRKVFQEIVMKSVPYIKGAREVRSTRQEVDLVSKFKGGIGAVSERFIAMAPGRVKVVVTDEISRPLTIITKGDPVPEVKAVIDFLRTDSPKTNFK